jgi:hypothetical protein
MKERLTVRSKVLLQIAAATAVGPALVVLLPGCQGESVNANVHCLTAVGPVANCEVTETEGKSEIEVCWDFTVTCKNGTKVEAKKNCAKVHGGGTTKHVIPGDKLKGAEKCDGNPVAAVTNLTLNGKPGM